MAGSIDGIPVHSVCRTYLHFVYYRCTLLILPDIVFRQPLRQDDSDITIVGSFHFTGSILYHVITSILTARFPFARHVRRTGSHLDEYHDFRLVLDTDIIPISQDPLPDSVFQGGVIDIVHMRMEEVD